MQTIKNFFEQCKRNRMEIFILACFIALIVSLIKAITNINAYIVMMIATVILAFVAVLQYTISKQQKDINEQKLKLDFFDRRFKVYENTKSLLNLVKNKTYGESDPGGHRVETGYFEAIMELKRETASARFLFKDDTIHEYVKEIHIHAESLHVASYVPEAYEHSRKWLLEQRVEIEDIFAPHLEFDFKNEKLLKQKVTE